MENECLSACCMYFTPPRTMSIETNRIFLFPARYRCQLHSAASTAQHYNQINKPQALCLISFNSKIAEIHQLALTLALNNNNKSLASVLFMSILCVFIFSLYSFEPSIQRNCIFLSKYEENDGKELKEPQWLNTPHISVKHF